MKNFFIVLLLFERLFACAQNSVIQYYAPNPGVQKAFVLYDNDSLIPTYELPNPLVLESGQKVVDSIMWWRQRRPELLSLFENEIYGKTPFFSQAAPGFLQYPVVRVLSEKKDVFNGKATRREVRLCYTQNDSSYYLDVLLYLPNHVKTKVPAYVMLNFRGNQSVTEDTDIHICESWMTPCSDGSVVNFHSTEKSRGIAKSRWPIEMIIDRGYALATACYQQLVPDYKSDSPQKIRLLKLSYQAL